MAVVDEDPVLASDLDRALGLGAGQPKPGESDRAFRLRTLNELIDERLRFHEIDRFGFTQVPVKDIDENVDKVRRRFKDDVAFRQRLKELGLDLAALRQLVARQLMVLTYVDERLGPRVFVGLDDIAGYYKTVLIPEMQKQGKPVPPLVDVREQIRAVLTQQRLLQELDRWTEELRRNAVIAVYFDLPADRPLPPVVKRIERPAAAPPATPKSPKPVRPKPPGSTGGSRE